jgi:hypothetical protein
MDWRSGFRPAGWVLALATAAAMAAVMVITAGGGASVAESTQAVSFEATCVLGPGVLNVSGGAKFRLEANGPSATTEGQEVQFNNATISVTLPTSWSEAFIAQHANRVQGTITRFMLHSVGLSPEALDIAQPPSAPSPEGLPFEAPLVKGSQIDLTAPTGTTFSFGPYKTIGHAGTEAGLNIGSEPGFVEEPEGGFRATGEGIILQIDAYENATRTVGPIKVACTANAQAPFTRIPIEKAETETTCDYFPEPAPPHIGSIDPINGAEAGGTDVTILGEGFTEEGSLSARSLRVHEVKFGDQAAQSFTVNSNNELTAVVPPGTGTVEVHVIVEAPTPVPECGGPLLAPSNDLVFAYGPTANVQYNDWHVTGALTDKRLNQQLALPEPATFSGSGELEVESGTGSVKGELAFPVGIDTLKLFGALSATLELKVSETALLAGTFARSQAEPNSEQLVIPTALSLEISSVGLLGLKIPTSCKTVEPLALALADTAAPEELLAAGWTFSGSTALPRFECHGGFLGHLFGIVLSDLLSGPENAYYLDVRHG